MTTTIGTGVRERYPNFSTGHSAKYKKTQVTTWIIVWKHLLYIKIMAR